MMGVKKNRRQTNQLSCFLCVMILFIFLPPLVNPAESAIFVKNNLWTNKAHETFSRFSLHPVSLLSLSDSFPSIGAYELMLRRDQWTGSNQYGFFVFQVTDTYRILNEVMTPFIIKDIYSQFFVFGKKTITSKLDFAYFPRLFPGTQKDKGFTDLLKMEEISSHCGNMLEQGQNITDGYVGLSIFFHCPMGRLLPYIWMQSGLQPLPSEDLAGPDSTFTANALGGLPIHLTPRCSLFLEAAFFFVSDENLTETAMEHSLICSFQLFI